MRYPQPTFLTGREKKYVRDLISLEKSYLISLEETECAAFLFIELN
jgi:hypothetical protein